MKDSVESYEILGLEPGASALKIRKAYLDLAYLWDPKRYVKNPIMLEKAEAKRKEVEEAFATLRSFVPGLESHSVSRGVDMSQNRDYNEMAVKPRAEFSRAVMGILAAVVLLVLFGLAVYVVHEGKAIKPSPTVEP